METTKANEDSTCSINTPTSDLNKSHDEKISNSKDQVIQDSPEEKVTHNKQDSFDNSDKKSGFEGFGFSSELLKNIDKNGYKEPTPIQKAAFPELMLGRDLVGQAQTGTGKTAAFALPILERLKENSKRPQVLVLAPTRELAMQVADSFRCYSARDQKQKILAVYGGADFRTQINALKRGVDVVVGTPGRVMDHMRQGTLNKDGLKCLVLDEADEMLRMGFIDDVEWVLDQLPKERQMVLFSATMPSEIRRLSKRYLNNPAEITIKAHQKEACLIKQQYIAIHNSHKIDALKRILEVMSSEGVIVFARTKMITLSIAQSLETEGHAVAVLNGDVPQTQRERTIERLRNGRVNILVATDVAARGLDVDRIGLVINYDMPFDSEAYVHRIGRTGRAGRSGEAILFVSPREKHFLRTLERKVGQPIEQMVIPDNSLVNKSRVAKLKKRLITAAAAGREHEEEIDILQQILKEVQEELNLDQGQLSLAAISLAIGTNPILERGDESWLQQAFQKHRRDDRRDKRINSRRRNDSNPTSHEDQLERFRVEVGHRDHVKPSNLVGAIANETGLKGRMIGRIQIFDQYSLIDLPRGMPENIFKDLKKVRVMNKELQINRANSK